MARLLHRDERGDATTEVVLVTPVLLLLIAFVLQFGLWYHASNVAQAAATEGVRAARADGGSAQAGKARAEDFLAQTGPSIVNSPEVIATRDTSAARVEVKGHAVMVVPGLRLPIDAVAESPLEEFARP
jgi:Flp pilus assembly protein TadG